MRMSVRERGVAKVITRLTLNPDYSRTLSNVAAQPHAYLWAGHRAAALVNVAYIPHVGCVVQSFRTVRYGFRTSV